MPNVTEETSLKRGVAGVLLMFFMVGEAVSLVGWSPSITTTLPMYIGILISLLIITLSILGVYGLLYNGLGLYPAVLVSAFEVILGAFSLNGLGQASLVRSSSYTVAGILSLGIVSALVNGQKNLNYQDGRNNRMVESKEGEVQGAVELIDVKKTYIQGPITVEAIRGITMKVQHGEFVAIMGTSGSGKSTFLNLIGALDQPTSGSIFIDGVEINTLNEDGLAKLRNEKIGFVFQSYNLVARSKVSRNMELPLFVKGYSKEERERRINELLAIVGLPDKASRKPNTLSGGEQQRVAIARALINNPTLILADEPTGNLDSKTGSQIIGYLRKINLEKQTTVVLVTHDIALARKADRIIQLRDGSIVDEVRKAG